jgi:hypothetical protein
VKSVTPKTKRATQHAEYKLYGKASPITFDAAKASNPALQSCMRGNYS